MAKMAVAGSSEALASDSQKAGESYRAQVIFASRGFELHPRSAALAEKLLDLIPKDDVQSAAWITFGDSQCDGESINDMKVLGRLGSKLPRNLARAVLLVPRKMQVYVSYAMTSVQDPHSDYAVRMRGVCELRHPQFIKALEGLSESDREWFAKHILNPIGCRVLALPEAE